MITFEKIIKAFKSYICDDYYRFLVNAGFGVYNKTSDQEYLSKRFRAAFGRDIDLHNPHSFNEKMQWLKLYNRKEEYTVMVDKYRVREYISRTIGEDYLIPLLGVWDNAEAIEFEQLPKQFVLKCNHNSGKGMIICKNKDLLDIPSTKKTLRDGLNENYYLLNREWPYKNVERRIIAEKYMVDGQTQQLIDYKVHCFNGIPRFVLVCSDRFSKDGVKEDFYDINWNRIPVSRPNKRTSAQDVPRPEQLDEILEISKALANNIPFLRTDFYIINGKVYFGEITFFPASGFSSFVPKDWDDIFGSWIKLPQVKQV